MSAASAKVVRDVLNSSRNAPPGPTPDGTNAQSCGTSTTVADCAQAGAGSATAADNANTGAPTTTTNNAPRTRPTPPFTLLGGLGVAVSGLVARRGGLGCDPLSLRWPGGCCRPPRSGVWDL